VTGNVVSSQTGLTVLGIDPGSSATGWALLTSVGTRVEVEDYGVIRTGRGERSVRLASLDRRLVEIVERCRPDVAAVETSFSGRNPRSGLVLAESRGVVLAVLGRSEVAVHSYTPAQVKTSIVGHGRAEKRQVVFMVRRLLGLDRDPPVDAADAMAIALTHVHMRRLDGRI
jgi:crossover junction endodeoxyribonuclease RuvC